MGCRRQGGSRSRSPGAARTRSDAPPSTAPVAGGRASARPRWHRPTGQLGKAGPGCRRALRPFGIPVAAHVGQAFLGLAHEPLELCLEFWIPVPLARGVGLPGRVGLLDGEVDLAVLLDGDHLDGDLVALVEVVPDVPHVVPVNLGNMHESGFSPGELYECSKICDSNNSALSDSSYFCQVTSPLIMERSSYRLKTYPQPVHSRIGPAGPHGAGARRRSSRAMLAR